MYVREFPPYALRLWKEKIGIQDFSNPLECTGSLVEMPDYTFKINMNLRQETRGHPVILVTRSKLYRVFNSTEHGEYLIRQQVAEIIRHVEVSILRHFVGYPPAFPSIATREVAPRIEMVEHMTLLLREYPANASLWLAGVPQSLENDVSLAQQVAAHLYFEQNGC